MNRRKLPLGITIGSLRMLNTYESAGVFEGRCSRLDDLVLQHLSTVRAMAQLDAYQETLCRMAAEGYTGTEIAAELGTDTSNLNRLLRTIRPSLYGVER